MAIGFECSWSEILSLKKQPVLHGSFVSLSVLLQLIPVLLLLPPQQKPQVECVGRWALEKDELGEFRADLTMISAGRICLKRTLPVPCKREAAYVNNSELQKNLGRKTPLRVCVSPLMQSKTSLGEVLQSRTFSVHEVSLVPFLHPVEGIPLTHSPAQSIGCAHSLVSFTDSLRVCSVFTL